MLRPGRWYIFAVLAIFLGALLAAGCAGGASAEKGKVIKIGQTEFDYEVPYVEIARQVARERGLTVDVVEGEPRSMFEALARGEIDLWPGIRLPSNHGKYHEKYGDRYKLGGTIFEKAPTGWFVTEYVDAESIMDLKGREDVVNNELLVYDFAGEVKRLSGDIINSNGLDLDIVECSMSSMAAKIEKALEQNENVLVAGWRPDSLFRRHSLKMLDDPEGYWAQDSCFWGTAKDLEEKAPGMYSWARNFNMSLDDTENYLFGYRVQDRNPRDLARAWIKKNRSQVNDWAGASSAGLFNRLGGLFNFGGFGNTGRDTPSWPYYDNGNTGRDTPEEPGNDTGEDREIPWQRGDNNDGVAPDPGEDDRGSAGQPEEGNKAGDTGAMSGKERQMLDLVNQERAGEGLAKFTVDSRLVELARKKSRDMYENNYFSHQSPTYGSPYEMEKDAGINARVMGAENIARANSVQRAHTMLMNSEGHRENIMDTNHDTIGIGIVEASGQLYVTQLFTGN